MCPHSCMRHQRQLVLQVSSDYSELCKHMASYSFYARFYLLVFTSRVNKEINFVEKENSIRKNPLLYNCNYRWAISLVKEKRHKYSNSLIDHSMEYEISVQTEMTVFSLFFRQMFTREGCEHSLFLTKSSWYVIMLVYIQRRKSIVNMLNKAIILNLEVLLPAHWFSH